MADDPAKPLLPNNNNKDRKRHSSSSFPPSSSFSSAPPPSSTLSSSFTNKTPSTLPNYNTNNNNISPINERHWSDETEDIGPDQYYYTNPASANSSSSHNPGSSVGGSSPLNFYQGFSGRRTPHPSGLDPRRHSNPQYRHQQNLETRRYPGRDQDKNKKSIFCCCCRLLGPPWRRLKNHFNNKYTTTEQRLMMAVGGLSVLTLVLLVVAVEAIAAGGSGESFGNNGLCTTAECTLTAAEILRDLKPSIDPCTDFFEFSCGGFMDRETIPEDKSSIGYFNKLHESNQGVLRQILSTEPPKGDFASEGGSEQDGESGDDGAGSRNLDKLQGLFKSCMDESRIEKIGSTPLVELIQQLIKTFPLDTPKSSVDFVEQQVDQRLMMVRPVPQRRRRSLANDDDILALENNHGQPEIKIFAEDVGEIWKRNDESQVVEETELKPNDGGKIDKKAMSDAMAQLALISIPTMIDFDVDSDPKNPDQNVFRLGEAGLGLPSTEYYTDEKIMAVYQKTIEELLVLIMGTGQQVDDINNNKPSQSWATVAKDIVDFETRLAAIGSKPEDLENSEFTFNPKTLDEIITMTPTIDWKTLLQNIFGPLATLPNPIIVSSPEYLVKLNSVLEETSTKTMQQFFIWKIIRSLTNNLGTEFRKPMQKLKAELRGVSAEVVTPRWQTCVEVVDSSIGQMAGHYFIERAFKGDSKTLSDEIIFSIRTAFSEGLPHLDWLDAETLVPAQEKVTKLVQKVGFSTKSPNVQSPESIEQYYKDLSVDELDFFGNQVRAQKWKTVRALGELQKPVDKNEWLMNPQTVNAYYNPSINEIVFPAGILQPPFFAAQYPEYLNYGGIGVVAGHELTHAFDNEGRLFDASGKLTNWWSNSTLAEFQQKSKCFINQYSNFTVADPSGKPVHVNGKLTLGENLADNGGLEKAFQAWQTRFNSDPKGEKYKNHELAGLADQYSREQLYYISYARVWCSRTRSASAIEGLRTDPHSPARWRVNGAVQNSEGFAKVFKCAKQAPMNPDNKCVIW